MQITLGIDANENYLHQIPGTYIEAIAEGKLNQLGKSASYQITTEKTTFFAKSGIPLCYLIMLDPQGFIIVSAYYELPAIIAYSFTHPLTQNQSIINQFISIITHDLTLRLEIIDPLSSNELAGKKAMITSLIKENDKESRFQQWPPEGTTPTDGWIETTWTQNPPYNNYCPMDQTSGQRSLAGCPAVAMAQILNYHATIQNTSFSDTDDYFHNYGGNQYWIDDDCVNYDFPSFPQLNNYLNTLTTHYQIETPPTDDDIAALTFACGIAAEQVYNSGGSGTFGVDQAYDAYQRFNFNTVDLLDEGDSDLYTRLSENIKNANPAHLAVVNEEWTVGHNLVIDGYNTDDYYHLNFGWGGSYDGWYDLPDELPYELTVIEGIILDIIPEVTNETYDINQPVFNRGFPIRHALDGDWAGAQNFTPTENTITSADIYLRKFGNPEFNLTVELREHHPQGTLIDTLTFTPEEVPTSWEWFLLNFIDTTVEPDTNLFIVIPPAPSGVTTSFGYEWGYAIGNQYDDGAFWFTRDGGGLWRDLSDTYEFCFRTYAISG